MPTDLTSTTRSPAQCSHLIILGRMEYITHVPEFYHKLWELRDTRVDHLPLMGGFLPVFVVFGLYVYLVKVWGPRYMEKRKPYDLRYLGQCPWFMLISIKLFFSRTFLVFYNAVQTMLSIWLFARVCLILFYFSCHHPCHQSITVIKVLGF